MEKIQIRQDWKSLSKPELEAYVEGLHEYIISFDASSIKRMINSLDKVSAKIADDLDILADGKAGIEVYEEDEEGIGQITLVPITLLSDSKDSKVFDRVLALAGRIKDFKSVSDMADAIKPEIVDLTTKKEVKENQTLKIEGNVFESIAKKYTEQNKK